MPAHVRSNKLSQLVMVTLTETSKEKLDTENKEYKKQRRGYVYD